jgi:hypothetical protein
MIKASVATLLPFTLSLYQSVLPSVPTLLFPWAFHNKPAFKSQNLPGNLSSAMHIFTDLILFYHTAFSTKRYAGHCPTAPPDPNSTSSMQLCCGKPTYVNHVGGLPHPLPTGWMLPVEGIERRAEGGRLKTGLSVSQLLPCQAVGW